MWFGSLDPNWFFSNYRVVLGEWHSSNTLAVVYKTEEKPSVSIILGQQLANETQICLIYSKLFGLT